MITARPITPAPCCQFVKHVEAVLAQLEAEYDTARDEAQRRQLEEMDTLKQNLALTRTPEHVATIFEQIDRLPERLQALVDTDPHGARRVLSANQVATVSVFRQPPHRVGSATAGAPKRIHASRGGHDSWSFCRG